MKGLVESTDCFFKGESSISRKTEGGAKEKLLMVDWCTRSHEVYLLSIA